MYDRQRFPCWAALCNATNAPAECFTGSKLCQHGMDECEGDSIEACAMYAYPSPTLYAPFVYCLEGQHGWWDGEAQKGGVNESFIEPCARHAGIDAVPIVACLNDEELTASLDREAARKTAVRASSVAAAQWGTPYVIVDGVHLDDTSQLLATVCDAWKHQDGPAPVGCKEGIARWLTVDKCASFAAGIGAGVIVLLLVQYIYRCCCAKVPKNPSSNNAALLFAGDGR